MSELVYLPVEQLWPHPDNPRKFVDDLEELTASIKEKGILQNLTVVHVPEHTLDEAERRKVFEETQKYGIHSDDYKKAKALLDAGAVPEHYTVICGHRRLAAAKEAGLKEAPCIIVEMTEKEQIQTMLLENMQRKNLKLYEEAQSFQTLLDFGDSVEEISQASGFSTTTIRRRVKLNELDKQKLKEVVDSRQIPLGDFDELAKIEDVSTRNELLEYVGTQNFRWKLNGAMERQEMNKKLPVVKAWLKENKIKKLPQGKEYSSEYERLGDSYDDYKIKDWDLVKGKIELKNGKEYFYQIDDLRCIVKLFLHKQAERVRRSQEEIDADKRINRAWAYLDRRGCEMCRRRQAFIEGLHVTKKNECAVLNGAVLRNMAEAFKYIYWDNKEIFELLTGTEYDYTKDDNFETEFETYRTKGREKLAKVIYLMWGDEEKRLPTATTYRRSWPIWEKSKYLTALYEWLVSMGYEMTEKEKDLMNGKDKIYVEDTEVSDSELVYAGEPVEDPEERPGEV